MDLSRLHTAGLTVRWIVLLPLISSSFWRLSTGAKTCNTMVVSGARTNTEANGHYELMSGTCYGRPKYVQITNSTFEPGNFTRPYYIYFSMINVVKASWTVGKRLCINKLTDTHFHAWSLSGRPDRVVDRWQEYESFWVHNKDFQITCTEGMAYDVMLGTIFGCILGAGVVITVIILAVEIPKRKKMQNRRPSYVDSTIQSIQQDNPMFQPGDHPIPLNYVENPPTYQEMLAQGPPVSRVDSAQGADMPSEKTSSTILNFPGNAVYYQTETTESPPSGKTSDSL